MNVKIPPNPVSLRVRRMSLLLLLSALFVADRAWAQTRYQDLDVSGCSTEEVKFAATLNTPMGGLTGNKCDSPVSTGCDIKTANFMNTVFWAVSAKDDVFCKQSGQNIVCGNINVAVPGPEAVAHATPAGITNPSALSALGSGTFSLLVADSTNANVSCERKYRFRVTNPGGGWGDPHLTTVDGVHYDFQSAGEFTALREPGFEVQTRQTPVPTTTIPGVNEYTGLGVCVSIYTAVAAQIGSNRVTYQPNLSQPTLLAQADPSGMQLRVNGKPVTLPEGGIDLHVGGGTTGPVEGRIVRAGDAGAIEIRDAHGTQLVVTPAFWSSQQKWYLNINAYQTSAMQGTMGLTTEGWLPALPDGKSLGKRPETAKERYQQLYETFADAWRVTAANSVFDYAAGTNTATFTLPEWPRFEPQSCAIQGQTSVQPTTTQAAEQACSGVTDPAQRADCVFDVTVTGETGFAQSYQAMQQFTPQGTGWQPVLAQVVPPTRLPWWLILLLILLLIIIVLIVRARRTA